MSLTKTDSTVTEIVPRRFSANTMTNLLSLGWKIFNQKTYYWIIHEFNKYNSKVNGQTMWLNYKLSIKFGIKQKQYNKIKFWDE